MKKIFSIIILLLAVNVVIGQTLCTRKDTIVITQDSVTLKAGPFRGAIQWQHSLDGKNWDNLSNKNNQTLKLSRYNEGMYRAEISDGTCNLVFSDTASIKSELPIVVIDSVFAITDSSAILYGSILKDGGAIITTKGACWNISGNPTIVDRVVYSNIDSTKFQSIVNGLNPNSTYFANVFVSNSNGTVYGVPIEFKTEKLKFSVTQYVEASSGSTINSPDGSSLTIPAGALQASGNVTIASVDENKQPNIPNENLMIFGNPFTINLPSNSLNENLKFSYTLETLPSQLENYVPCLYDGKSFYPIEYTISGNTVTATIDKLSWENYSSLKSATLVGEAITIVSLIAIQAPPARQMGIKEVGLSNGEMFFAEPSAISDASEILLLIHGWTDKPETWTNFIQKIKLESDIKFDKIWTFGYNSSLGIDENGAKLSGGLAIYTHGAKVKIVAHSMGGLVARSMIENYGGSIYVKKLITLGTPHLGSPLGALRDMLGSIIAIESTLAPENCVPGTSFIYDYKTQGFRDLDENSDFIADLKTTLTSPVPYYCIAGVNLPTDNVFIPGQDDFAVGLSSALGAPTPVYRGYHEITCSIPDFAHNKLLTNGEVFFKTKELLKNNYTFKVIQGDNQEGKPGQKLQLPIIVEVLDEMNKPVKGERVYFESEYYPGKYLTIDSRDDGEVAVEWTLDNFEGAQKINVFLTDDIGNKIEKSTITITANCKIDVPAITTNIVSYITENTATCGGNIIDDGGAEIIARGICWNTIGTPTIFNSKIENGTGTGAFTSDLSGLTEGTTYYVRAYATNSKGTAYGNPISFTTNSAISITTSQVTNITQTTATSGGIITSEKTITTRGVCWNATGNPTIQDNKTNNGNGTGIFTSFLTNLSKNTTYYIRAYANYSNGVEYGNQLSFKTGDCFDYTKTGTVLKITNVCDGIDIWSPYEVYYPLKQYSIIFGSPRQQYYFNGRNCMTFKFKTDNFTTESQSIRVYGFDDSGNYQSYVEIWDLEKLEVIANNHTNPEETVYFKAKPNTTYGGIAWYQDNSQRSLDIYIWNNDWTAK